MIIFWYSLFCLLLHQTGGTPATTDQAENEDALVSRILRDITGQYHPELHGEHAHKHAHSHLQTVHSHSSNDGTGGSVQIVEVKSPGVGGSDAAVDASKFFIDGGYYLPPPPPVYQPPAGYEPPPPPPPQTPELNGYANCACVEKGRCAKEVKDYQPILLSRLKNDVRCGVEFELCCPDDPWPGPIDQFKDQMQCYPQEYCLRKYGDSPYDIQTYGALGPCLGLGSVRCIEPRPPGPVEIVVPIYNPPPPVYEPPPPPPPTTVPTTPPTTVPTTTPIPPVYEPPTTQPPVIYEPPTTQPPVIYEPPTTQPPVIYEPPAPLPPATYEPPVDTYEPPAATYEPPVPVDTYEPPVPTDTYEPPVPTDTYEPPVPTDTYEPPVPTDTYEPPVPATDYGVPAQTYPSRPYRRYPGYFSRYGYGFGGYPGIGFRKRIRFSKVFFG